MHGPSLSLLAVCLHPLQGSTPLSECKGHTGAVRHVSFLPRAASAAAGLGRTPLLLTGSDDWTARVWDAESGSCRGACVGHGGAVTAMQTIHSSAATRFVTGAADGSVGLWCLDGEMVGLVQQHEEPVMLLKQGGDTLVSGAHRPAATNASKCIGRVQDLESQRTMQDACKEVCKQHVGPSPVILRRFLLASAPCTVHICKRH